VGIPESAAICRDCVRRVEVRSSRCVRCGGPRLVAHDELFDLRIAHVDCDAFYAAVEKRDDPSLAERPVIVGGGKRGVVAAACYVARTYGVRSAMPMFRALKACPDAVVIRPDMAKYAAVGRQVRDLMLALTPDVEPLSIDEAFLDLTGTDRLHRAPAALVLAGFQRQVEREMGISVSIGLSHNKFLAKLASDLDKPRGFAVIGRAETTSFLAARPVSLIWGVGEAMQKRLASDGLMRIGDVQKLDEQTLAARYGAMGLRLARLSRGEDDRSVSPDRQAKGISAEITFERDLGSAGELLPFLRDLAETVSARLKKQSLAARVVTLKLKSSGFKLRTRQLRLNAPTSLADRLFHAARSLLAKELDGTRFRLIGIGVSEVAPAEFMEAGDLMDAGAAKRASAEMAMDRVRARFGRRGLGLGLTFGASPNAKPSR
jgi:DNA polymerase-4